METPLQLYKKAYHLHYREKNIDEARRLYQEIIEEHADSDASLYASIQLSRIQPHTSVTLHTDSSADTIPPRRSSSGRLVILVCLNCLLTIAVLVGLVLHFQLVQDRNKSMSTLIQGIGKLVVGKDDEALDLLKELKITRKRDITPYVISADIYCTNHDYLNARKEYETFDRLYPGDALVRTGVKQINREEDAYIKNAKKRNAVQDSVVPTKPQKSSKTIIHEPEPAPRIIRRDDISYF